MKKKRSVMLYLMLVFGVLIMVNYIAQHYFFRVDVTSDNRYTLSETTKEILRELNEPVTIKAYFTKDLPQEMGLAQTARDFQDLLMEYASISRGNVEYEFLDPDEGDKMEQEALQSGIQPLQVDVRENNKAVQKKVYLGALLYYGENTDVIPVVVPGAAMEYMLSKSVKRITVKDREMIGILQGHGEPSIYSMPQAMSELSIQYTMEPVYLTDSTDALSNYQVLAIIAPTDTLPAAHIEQLDRFLAQGKNLFIAYNRVKGDLNSHWGYTIYTGIEDWLLKKDIRMDNNFVIDVNCGKIGIPQQIGPLVVNSNVDFYFVPIITHFAKHLITSGLEAIGMIYASTISFLGDSTIHFTPLAMTSDRSGTRHAPAMFDFEYSWQESDFPLKGLVVSGLFEGKLAGNASSKIVVITDGDFLINGEGQEAKAVNEDNISYMVNSVDYLTGNTGLVSLRTKNITSRPIDQLEDGEKAFLKWFNFSLPIVIIILFGLFRNQQNKLVRKKRMEEGHV